MSENASEDMHEDGESSVTAVSSRSLRERLAGSTMAVFAFMVSYVLTAGPASVLVRKFDTPFMETVIRGLYAPLIFLVNARIPGISSGIKWYVGLFK